MPFLHIRYIQIIFEKQISVVNTSIPVDRYPYHWYTILLGATRALAHIGVHFTHHVFGLSSFLDFGVLQLYPFYIDSQGLQTTYKNQQILFEFMKGIEFKKKSTTFKIILIYFNKNNNMSNFLRKKFSIKKLKKT